MVSDLSMYSMSLVNRSLYTPYFLALFLLFLSLTFALNHELTFFLGFLSSFTSILFPPIFNYVFHPVRFAPYFEVFIYTLPPALVILVDMLTTREAHRTLHPVTFCSWLNPSKAGITTGTVVFLMYVLPAV